MSETNTWAYVIHYTNAEKTPIAVEASGRSEARKIGRKARDCQVSAAVREDEGATLSDKERNNLSTIENPYRFIENVLNA